MNGVVAYFQLFTQITLKYGAAEYVWMLTATKIIVYTL